MVINIEPKHIYYSGKYQSIYTDPICLAVFDKLFSKKRSDLLAYVKGIALKSIRSEPPIPRLETDGEEIEILFDLKHNDPWKISDHLGSVPEPINRGDETQEYFSCTIKMEQELITKAAMDYVYEISSPYQVLMSGGNLSLIKEI